MQRFAEQTTPTFTDLLAAAPGIDKAFTSLPAFSRGTEKFLETAGQTAKLEGPALKNTTPLLKQLQKLGGSALPFTENFSQLLESLRETGGLERIMDFIFLGTGAANGYTSLSHFLRAEGVANVCLSYAIATAANGGCRRKLFSTSSGASASAASASPTSLKSSSAAAAALDSSSTSVLMARTLAVMEGATPQQALAKYPGSTTGTGAASAPGAGAGATVEPVGGSTAGTTYYTPARRLGSRRAAPQLPARERMTR